MRDIDIQEFIKPEPVVIHATNVAEYVASFGRLDGWDLTTFKCSRPAFPFMDIKFIPPVKINKTSLRALIGLIKKDDDFLDVTSANNLKVTKEGTQQFSTFRSDLLSRGLHDLLSIAVMPDWDNGKYLTSIYLIGLDEKGQLLEDSKGNAYFLVGERGLFQDYIEQGKIDKVEWPELQRYILLVALATLNFLNCRNVVVEDNPPSRQQKRHAQQKGEPEPLSYKTLTILPNRKRRNELRLTGGEAAEKRALHIVRGHFKDYRQGRGLGRGGGHGLWWWSPSVRGSDSTRAVVKDYEVEMQ